MQRVVIALALSGASAFVAPVPKAVQQVRMSDDAEAEAPEVEAAPAPAPPKPAAAAPTGAFSRQDLYDYAASMPGFGTGPWDPLGLADQSWAFGERTPFSNEATIGFLRHAEIKHGRVAMAAFLGFIAQSTALVSGEHTFAPYRGYVAGCTPQEQWDNIPVVGKLQILIAIGMLESYGEGAGDPAGYTHYMKGGKPGYYPPIAGRAGFGQVTLNLWRVAASEDRVLRSTVPAHEPSVRMRGDGVAVGTPPVRHRRVAPRRDPFNLVQNNSAEKKARGLKSEILNGRAARPPRLKLMSWCLRGDSVGARSYSRRGVRHLSRRRRGPAAGGESPRWRLRETTRRGHG